MIEYHKIQSVYLRDPTNHHKTFLEGEWSEPEFGYLATNEWLWTEKVDGTHVRVHWDGFQVRFGGRHDNSQIPTFLLHELERILPAIRFRLYFPHPEYNDVVLFGEVYGAKIQKSGGQYNPVGCGFVLFDVMIGGIYLERANVEDIANKMGLRIVPVVDRGSLYDAIEMTRAGFNSAWGPFTADGLVMRPSVELFTRRGYRIITKVKHKDFA